jgi:hypothetical protein
MPRRNLRPTSICLTAVGLAAYLFACSFGHAGYVLCAEEDGSAVVEVTTGLVGCGCPSSAADGNLLPDGCGPCADQPLGGEVVTRVEVDIDGPPAALSLMPHDRGLSTLSAHESLRWRAHPYVPRDTHLSRSPILLI